MRITSAVLGAMGAESPFGSSKPLAIETLELDGPGPGEVLVRIKAAGLCHSDLSVINGDRPRPMPMALGHEAAGVIEELGPVEGDAGCSSSPASATGVLTVAATTRTDARAVFSNWGRCVDIYAPGAEILSTGAGGGTATFSGTSMASPHVAGAMALEKAYGDRRSSQINRRLIRHATVRLVTDNPLGTPNQLLHVDRH